MSATETTTPTVRWTTTPDGAIAGTITNDYRPDFDYAITWEIAWLAGTDRFVYAIKRDDGSPWSPISTLASPERFGPLPMDADGAKAQRSRARAIIAAFYAEAVAD